MFADPSGLAEEKKDEPKKIQTKPIEICADKDNLPQTNNESDKKLETPTEKKQDEQKQEENNQEEKTNTNDKMTPFFNNDLTEYGIFTDAGSTNQTEPVEQIAIPWVETAKTQLGVKEVKPAGSKENKIWL